MVVNTTQIDVDAIAAFFDQEEEQKRQEAQAAKATRRKVKRPQRQKPGPGHYKALRASREDVR